MPTQRRSLPLPCAMEGFVLSQGLQPQSSIVSCSKTRVTLTIFVLFQRISFCASTSVSIYTSIMDDALEGTHAGQIRIKFLANAFFCIVLFVVTKQLASIFKKGNGLKGNRPAQHCLRRQKRNCDDPHSIGTALGQFPQHRHSTGRGKAVEK